MWAQLVKVRVAEGKFDELMEFNHQWEAQVGRAPGSGWAREFVLRSSTDPNEMYMLVYFDNEEKARANERNPQHLDLIAQWEKLLDGEPQFVDLNPVEEAHR